MVNCSYLHIDDILWFAATICCKLGYKSAMQTFYFSIWKNKLLNSKPNHVKNFEEFAQPPGSTLKDQTRFQILIEWSYQH